MDPGEFLDSVLAELQDLPDEVRATGGGAMSRLWIQVVADVIGAPVVTLRETEAAAYGAALQSVWNWRLARGEKTGIAEIAAKWVVKDKPAARQKGGGQAGGTERGKRQPFGLHARGVHLGRGRVAEFGG